MDIVKLGMAVSPMIDKWPVSGTDYARFVNLEAGNFYLAVGILVDLGCCVRNFSRELSDGHY